MTAPFNPVTTALAPGQSAPPSAPAWVRALLATMRNSLAGAREAIDRMNKLIGDAHLDRSDH